MRGAEVWNAVSILKNKKKRIRGFQKYNELICSYYRRRKEKRNELGSRSAYGNIMAH